jgi:hypothetical protein
MPLIISHPKSNTIADFTGTVTQFNSSGGTQSVAATNLVRPSDWNNAHTFAPDPFFYEPFPMANTNSTLSTAGAGTWSIDPMFLPVGLISGELLLFNADVAGFLNGGAYSSAVTGTVTRNQTLNTQVVIYMQGTGTAYTQLSTVWSKEVSILATWARSVNSTTAGGGTTTGVIISNALTLSMPSQWDTAGGITYGTTSQSGTTSTSVSTGNSTLANNLITNAVAYGSGSKMIPIPFNTMIQPGEYYLGIMTSSSSNSAGTNYSAGTMFSTQSIMGMLVFNNNGFKRVGQSVSNTSTQPFAFFGVVNTTSTSPPATLGATDIVDLPTLRRLDWKFVQTAW